eukprot:14413150-Alexandrium_andersonii.AAC.1
MAQALLATDRTSSRSHPPGLDQPKDPRPYKAMPGGSTEPLCRRRPVRQSRCPRTAPERAAPAEGPAGGADCQGAAGLQCSSPRNPGNAAGQGTALASPRAGGEGHAGPGPAVVEPARAHRRGPDPDD